jgi:ATP-dependent DNA ligase
MDIKIIKDYEQLMKKDKNNKIRLWKLQAVLHNQDKTYWISTTYGMKNGKMITTEKEVKQGKNIGKKNETSIEQQLILICDKTFKDKVEKEAYKNNDKNIDEEDNKSFAPMLASTWDLNSKVKHKVDIVFPCYIQPKLDGIRCLIYIKNGEIVNQSRQLKYFKNLSHINNELSDFFKKYQSIVLDGELYNHDIEFNRIAGIIKKEKLKEEDSRNLLNIEYHIYDCFTINEPAPFDGRMNFLKKEIKNMKYIKLLQTIECKSPDNLLELHSKFIENKYEGTILRNKDAYYEFTRSKNLQKFKSFMDDEFEIVNYKQGSGHDEGAVIWRCKNKEGKEFDCRPTGSIEERKKYFENGHKYIGKMLTITYQELSEYGIPRFPVGKSVRDYE